MMKRIGIIGGLGPQATMDLVARIHRVSQKLVKQFVNRGYPPLWVHYFRNAPMILNKDGSVPEKLNPDPELLAAAKNMGPLVDFIIIASNTPHFFIDHIEQASGHSVLNIVDVVMADVKQRQAKKVGVLAIGETLQHRLYQDPLDAAGIEWNTITDAMSKPLDDAIYAVMEGKGTSNLGEPARKSVTYLREQGVDNIILGCTEIPLLLGDDADASDLINPAQLLAEAAVKQAIEE